MHKHFRRRLTAALSLTVGIVGIVGSMAAAADPAVDRPTQSTTADGIADTVNAYNGALTVLPRADVTKVALSYEAGTISFGMWRMDATAPLADLNWTSDYTYGQWWLDVTGDLVTDYVVQYSVQDGEIVGIVNRAGDPDDADPLCTADRAVNEAGIDAFAIDAGCLGNPDRISYQMAIFYDSGVNDDTKPVLTDAVPDHGMTGPVFAPAGATKPLSVDTPASTAPKPVPGAPVTSSSTVVPTTAPGAVVPTTAPGPPASPGPVATPAPTTKAPTTRRAPAPAAAAPKSGVPAPRPSTAAGATKTAPSAPTGTTTSLARTGAPQTLRLLGFGLGLLLIGLGMRIMAGERRPVGVPI